MGALFNKWIRSNYAMISDPVQFTKSPKSVVFLDASGQKLLDFANSHGCGLQKQPDFVAKSKGKLIVGKG